MIFEELVAEAEAAPVDGWEFSWLDGRASEQRPSWGYAKAMGERMARAQAALDLQTGGGEVLAEVPRLAPLTVATESWPPNLAKATTLLRPRGVAVIDDGNKPPLPFADGTFDLVVSRHPEDNWWSEIARVLTPGGIYFSQQIGPATVVQLVEHFLGPQRGEGRNPQHARDGAEAAGFQIVDLRLETLNVEFKDIGAVIYFLRKVIWVLPDFTVEKYRTELRSLHNRIEAEGPFVTTTTRFLIETRKPTRQ